MLNKTTITSLKTYLSKVPMKLSDFAKHLHYEYHRVTDMLLSLRTIAPLVVGVMLGVWGSDIYTNLMHIKCDSGSNWEAFRVSKNGEEFCFMKETKFPYRIRGGRY